MSQVEQPRWRKSYHSCSESATIAPGYHKDSVLQWQLYTLWPLPFTSLMTQPLSAIFFGQQSTFNDISRLFMAQTRVSAPSLPVFPDRFRTEVSEIKRMKIISREKIVTIALHLSVASLCWLLICHRDRKKTQNSGNLIPLPE